MGGNLAIGKVQAQRLDLKATSRSHMVPKLNELLHAINAAYQQSTNTPLWSPKLLKSGQFLSGSSLHLFNLAGISDTTFIQKKPSVGDIDTMVDRNKELSLQQFLTAHHNRPLGPAVCRGFQKGNEQFSALFELQDPPVTVQIDFEFVDFQDNSPSDWAKFSHSSSWEDMQQGVKGVFHKLLIQSLAALSKREFYQRKMVGRGKLRGEQDIPTTDNMYSFAVSSKEGGGLRAKYEPVMGANGRPEVKDGLPVMTAAPTTGYIKDVGQIFSTLLGKRLPPATLKTVAANFWSFTGIINVLAKLLTPEEKAAVVDSFIIRTIGPNAQGMYKNNPRQDIQEKTVALNYIMQQLGVSKPKEFDQLLKNYQQSYKMTTESVQLSEAPTYKRKGIPHIYNPGSTVEINDIHFIDLCQEIAADGGTLDSATINLKVDGAGIRFGRDGSGKPFFMTSRVTEPKYLENFGDFEQYNRELGQPEERIAFAKNYDNALKIILSSDIMKAVPSDTIVQAEMLFNDMAQKSEDGYKFVHMSYDPRKLGQVMTLAPFSVKQYSTGDARPDAAKIQKNLLKTSNDKVKIISNTLSHQGIDVSKIVNPIAASADSLKAALAVRGTDAKKEKAKEIIAHSKKNLSETISNSPIAGKDQLGSNIEGLVINLPSGKTVKVTSQAMKDVMAAKKAPAGKRSGKIAVVTAGSFAGHRGHEQLVNTVLERAAALGADPYVYISPVTGADDPIPPQMKLATWQKLYPKHANMFQVWQEGGTPIKKIEKELVTSSNPPPYDKIIVIVGDDRYEGFKKWLAHLSKRMKNPQYPGFDHVQFYMESIPRSAESGGTGVAFSDCREVLKNPELSEKQKLAYWCKAFDVERLGVEWINQLMNTARKNMGIQSKQEKLKEFVQRVRPLLKDASTSKKLEVLSFIKESLQDMTKDEESDIPPPENARKTQIVGTLPTYHKGKAHLDTHRPSGKTLDFGAGLGGGAAAIGADSYEPYPQKGFTPTYSKAEDIPDNSYERITNFNVLNVVPENIRRAIVQNIGRILAPGGVAIITTRGKDVMTAKGKEGPEPMSRITTIGTYQKGFTTTELKQYVQAVLGDQFTVNSLKLGPAGVIIRKAEPVQEDENPADTLYFFDLSNTTKSFAPIDLKVLGLKQTAKGKWYYRPGYDTTPTLLRAALNRLEQTLNTHAKPWKPVKENAEHPFDLGERHTMDYGMRKFMVHKLARATGYETSALELASDDELRDLFQQVFPDKDLTEDYLDE